MNARFWPRICWSSSNCHIIPGKSLLEHVRNFAPWVLTSEHIWCWTDWLFQNILHNTYFKENSQFNWLLWHKARSSRDQKYGYRKCATTAAWRSDEYCFGKWLVKRNPLEWPRKSTQALAPTLYCANQLASDQGVASKSTFYRVLASSGWKKKSSFLLPVPTQNVPPAVAWRAKSKVPKGSRHIQRLAINCSDTLQGSSVTGRATGNVETGPKLPKTFYALFLTQWTVLSFPFHVFIVVECRKILKTQNDPHARWRRK